MSSRMPSNMLVLAPPHYRTLESARWKCIHCLGNVVIKLFRTSLTMLMDPLFLAIFRQSSRLRQAGVSGVERS